MNMFIKEQSLCLSDPDQLNENNKGNTKQKGHQN